MINSIWLRQLPYNPLLPRGTDGYLSNVCSARFSPGRQLLTWCSPGVYVASWFWQLFSWKNQCLCLKENKRKKEKESGPLWKITRRKALIGDRIIDTVFKGCFPQSNTSNMQLLLKGLISSLSYTKINFIIELVSTVCK